MLTASVPAPVCPLDYIDVVSTSAKEIHPDAQLLSRILLRDECAMASLYDVHSRLVYSVALRVLRDASAAEDVLQDVFLKIWRDPSSFLSARGSLGTWLSAIARNRAIDVLRRRRPTESVDDVPLQAPGNLFASVERRLMLQRASVLIARLPKAQSEALELSFFGGLTHAEIAERIKVPLGTVKTRIRTALLFLGNASRRPA